MFVTLGAGCSFCYLCAVIPQKLLFTSLFLLLSILVQAQILDDSTKQVYGPTTTRFLYERDLLSDREEYNYVDTSLNNFHNYDFLSRNRYRYVDLGNLGSAMRPVFYAPPAEIGVYSGFNAYNPYFYYPDDIRYYDTKSPYSSLYYVQGGLLQQLLKVDFSRNITKDWNAGFNYARTTAPMQFDFEGSREQSRAIDGHAFSFYTRYESPDSAYHVLAHLCRILTTLQTISAGCGRWKGWISATRTLIHCLSIFRTTVRLRSGGRPGPSICA
jgi:hypothetical protein